MRLLLFLGVEGNEVRCYAPQSGYIFWVEDPQMRVRQFSAHNYYLAI